MAVAQAEAAPSPVRGPPVALEQDGPPIEQLRIRVLPDGRVDRRNAAIFLGRTVSTLADWHKHRVGPPSILINRRRFYRLEDLRAYVARGRVMPGAGTRQQQTAELPAE